jgi:hypothetical protein
VPELESAWLFKIAHNVCLSRRRSSWRRGRIEAPTDFEIVEELAPAPSRRADELIGLQDVLEQLPEQQRRAILLREWQGLSYREISEELELSQAAVETLIFRARRSLAQGLEQPAVVQRQKRKRLGAGLVANLVSSGQSFLVGGGAAVKVAATVAVVSAGTVVATAPGHPHLRPAAPVKKHVHGRPAHTAPAPAAPVAVVPPHAAAPAVRQAPHRTVVRHRAAAPVVRTPAPPPVTPAATTSVETTPTVPPADTTLQAPPQSDAPGQVKQQEQAPPAHSPAHGRESAPGRQKQHGPGHGGDPSQAGTETGSQPGSQPTGGDQTPAHGRQKDQQDAPPPSQPSTGTTSSTTPTAGTPVVVPPPAVPTADQTVAQVPSAPELGPQPQGHGPGSSPTSGGDGR